LEPPDLLDDLLVLSLFEIVAPVDWSGVVGDGAPMASCVFVNVVVVVD
jgi:hypothetical protein